MKNLLFIMPALPGGGAEKVLYDIIKHIDKTKYNIDILLIENSGIYIDKIEKLGIHIYSISNILNFPKPKKKNFISYIKYKTYQKIQKNKKKLSLKFPNHFIKLLKTKKYHAEISFLEGKTTVLLSKRKTTAKKIAWVHIDLEKHRTLPKELEKKTYENIDEIICVSNKSKQSVLNLYPNLKNKIKTIYNPIPKEDILKLANCNRILFPKNKINLITVGRLTHQKGFDILLKAHNKLIHEGLDYNLYILGEGNEKENLTNYIQNNSLEGNTFLLGFKENPYPYIKQADIFVSSSRYEGYPLVICEALCLEKPIIATKCTGSTEILNNGEYGILVDIENVDELANAMKKLILDKNSRTSYSNLSKERNKTFNIEKIIQEIENLF